MSGKLIGKRRVNQSAMQLIMTILFVLSSLFIFADDKIYPDRPNPPRLVNDYAKMLSANENAQLEQKLEEFARSTSTQITIVTVTNLGGHDVADYSVEVFNRWGLGQAGKNNGVLLLASLEDRKAWITVGKGLEGVLTDAKSGLIFRNELRPAFKDARYFDGLDKSADAIIAVTKGEYKGEPADNEQKHAPITGIIIFIIFIVIIIRIFRGGGGGGGNYMSGRGAGNFLTGMIIGDLLGGGGNRGGFGGGFGGGGGGGGFGGFGGGSTGGGGAGGSW